MSFGSVPSWFLFFLLFLASISAEASLDNAVQEANERWVMEPAAAPLGSVVLSEARRRLGSFQICALCTCCGGPRGVCLPSPCCYAINCNIPNRPFGFCSFTPKSCNCFGCHL